MPFSHSKHRQDMQRIIDTLEERSFNTYAQKYVTYPKINTFQLHYIFLFLTTIGIRPEERDSICLTQTYIQMGLDSHEHVTNDHISTDVAIKNRQLTVLSGDFFSSHYYYYLAQIGEVALIKEWASVIQKVNEQKMTLHLNKHKMSEQQQLELRIQINSTMPVAVLNWYDAAHIWHDFLRLYIYIQQEVERNHVDSAYIEKSAQQLRKMLLLEPLTHVHDELMPWIDELNRNVLVES